METKLTFTISLADIKESVDRRFHTDCSAHEYMTQLGYTDKALEYLLGEIRKEIVAFAKTQLEEIE